MAIKVTAVLAGLDQYRHWSEYQHHHRYQGPILRDRLPGRHEDSSPCPSRPAAGPEIDRSRRMTAVTTFDSRHFDPRHGQTREVRNLCPLFKAAAAILEKDDEFHGVVGLDRFEREARTVSRLRGRRVLSDGTKSLFKAFPLNNPFNAWTRFGGMISLISHLHRRDCIQG